MPSTHVKEHDESGLPKRASLGFDEDFSASIPAIETSESHASRNEALSRGDATFMQNQVSLKRNPSLAKSSRSSTGRPLSYKSDTIYDAGIGSPSISSVLEYNDDQSHADQDDADQSSGLISIRTKSPSGWSDRSISTIRSTKSVQSMQAIGAYPLGSLRVLSQESPDMENCNAPECLSSGDVIIITGIPQGSFIGCDTIGLNVGQDAQFEGIRDLPPGAHLLYGGSSNMVSTRNGFWLMSKNRTAAERGEIHVKRWDKYTETIEEEISQAEIRIQKQNVPMIFDRLLPYTGDLSPNIQASSKGPSAKDPNMWQQLTFAITGVLLSRVTNRGWNEWQVSSTDEYRPISYQPLGGRDDARLRAAGDHRSRLEYLNSKDQVLSFIFPQNTSTFSKEAIGRERTEQAMDTSAHILNVISENCTYGDPDEVIGELQFCFLTGMLLGNIACMEQWTHVTKIIFKAFDLSVTRPIFFRKLIGTFHSQLMFNEEGLEGSIFDHDSHLEDDMKMLLTVFKSRLTEKLLEKGSALTDDQNAVGAAFEALESWLWKWDWDLRGNYVRSGRIQLEDGEFVDAELQDFEAEDERGEFAPVVVDVDENGRERGLLRW